MAITLDGTNGITLPGSPEIFKGPLTSSTAKTASGTSVDFDNIPSWVKRITVMLSAVSTSGTSNWILQLGTSSGIESSSYTSVGTFLGASTAGVDITTGFGLRINSASHVMQGHITITQLNASSITWTCFGGLAGSGAGAGFMYFTSGSKSLAGVLDRIRITTVNGTDTFDAGTINILYE